MQDKANTSCARLLVGLFRLSARSMWRSVPVFRLFGVPMLMHTSWLLFPGGWLVFLAVGRLFPVAEVALLLGCLLPSVLAHEFAHVLVGRWFGWHTRRVVFFPFGCAALMDEEPEDGRGEFWMAVAGPLVSLLIAGGAACYLIAQGRAPRLNWLFHKYPIASMLVTVNVYFACFNLIPCFPMDGGRMVRAALGRFLVWCMPEGRRAAHLMATWITVRCVALPLAAGMVVITLWHTHIWTHVVLFPLVWAAGELELRMKPEMPRARVVTLALRPAQAARLVRPGAEKLYGNFVRCCSPCRPAQ